MKRLIVLLLVIGASTILIATSINTPRAPKAAAATAQQPTPIIDGALTPEKISDHLAYSMLFRLISDHRGMNDRQRLDGYFDMIALERADRDVLISAAESLRQSIAPLDRQAKEIKDRNWPNPSPQVMEQLTQLQRSREAITDGAVASLSYRLSTSGVQRLRQFIDNRVKRRVKILPPTTLPGGPGWRHSPANHH